MERSKDRPRQSSSAPPRRSGRAERTRLKRLRRRRLIPLGIGLVIVAMTIAITATYSGGRSEALGATSSTTLAATTSSTAPAVVDAAALARSVKANEMGQVLVLMYHLIAHDKSEYNRTPEEFRQDLADLKARGYYPVNLSDFATGNVQVPAGKTPVVITFDDSSGGQYRINADGQLDPNCAVAIMQEMAGQGGWASRASFYPLIDVDAPDHVLFGQPELAQNKLQQLVAWGYEVGSHTVTHLNLQKAAVAEIKKQLYVSEHTLEQMIGGGYKVTSLAAPFGGYPAQISLLKSGEYQGKSYSYSTALKATGGASFSPFSQSFYAFKIPRIEVTGTTLKDALAVFDKSPGLRYISDGDPDTVAVPASLDPSLGSVRTGLGEKVVRY